MFFKLLASFGGFGRVEDGGDDTDAARAGGEDFVDILQRDAANGKPWPINVFGRPTAVESVWKSKPNAFNTSKRSSSPTPAF